MTVDAKDLMMAGQLTEARAQLTAEVRAAPTDVRKRTLLFQVLAALGEWEKAEKHLDMIANLDVRSGTGVQAYGDAINAEKERREVAERKRLPGFVSEAPVVSRRRTYAAWDALMEKKLEEATTLYSEVDRQRPVVSGSAGGRDFIGFSDTDAFLSCFLEAFVHDRYVWIPFESLAELAIASSRGLPRSPLGTGPRGYVGRDEHAMLSAGLLPPSVRSRTIRRQGSAG